MDCITFGDGTANPPHGILGGTAAIGGGQYVEDAAQRQADLRLRLGPDQDRRGQHLDRRRHRRRRLRRPLERTAERVRAEVRDRVISREAAYEVFGVVLGEGDDPQLDEAATAARRAELGERELPLVTPTVADAWTWFRDDSRDGDVYLENPTGE